MGVSRNILLLSLLSGYLLVSCDAMGRDKSMRCAYPVSHELRSAASAPSHHSQHWRTSLRHLVMAKAVPTFSLGPVDTRADRDLQQKSAVWRDISPHFFSALHCSCLCDRAPPLS